MASAAREVLAAIAAMARTMVRGLRSLLPWTLLALSMAAGIIAVRQALPIVPLPNPWPEAPPRSSPARVVPAVTGLPARDAFAVLRSRGLKPVQVNVVDAGTPPGLVQQQSPGPQAPIPRDLSVVLTIAEGAGRLPAPDLLNKPVAAAIQELGRERLCMAVSGLSFSPLAPGAVVSQNPAPGSLLRPGGRIVLVLSAGPIPRQIVPQLVGLTLSQAVATGAAHGITVRPDNSSAPGDYFVVRDQSIPPGTQTSPAAGMTHSGQPVLKPIVVTVSVESPGSDPQSTTIHDSLQESP